jgi:hypothetical protein
MATLDLRLRSSCCPRKPKAVANEGLAATTGSLERVTVVRTDLGFLVDFADFFTTTLAVDLGGVLAAFESLLAALT